MEYQLHGLLIKCIFVSSSEWGQTTESSRSRRRKQEEKFAYQFWSEET